MLQIPVLESDIIFGVFRQNSETFGVTPFCGLYVTRLTVRARVCVCVRVCKYNIFHSAYSHLFLPFPRTTLQTLATQNKHNLPPHVTFS